MADPVRPLRILVVDDDHDSADSLALLVRAWGYETRTAYDGPAALGLVGDFKPDVVLLDLALPRLSGYEVARRIRAGCPHPCVLIAVTGYGNNAAPVKDGAAATAAMRLQ